MATISAAENPYSARSERRGGATQAGEVELAGGVGFATRAAALPIIGMVQAFVVSALALFRPYLPTANGSPVKKR